MNTNEQTIRHQTQAYPNNGGLLFQVLKGDMEVYGKTFETIEEYEDYCGFMGIQPSVIPATDY